MNISPVQICCISIQSFKSKQTTTFSLVNCPNEKELLATFLVFAKNNSGRIYIGWNISDSTYGIQAIQNRIYQLIGDVNLGICECSIYDLDSILEWKFGHDYVSHPKLYRLASLNGITTNNYIEGSKEQELFENSDYKSIELSTNRKVRMISNISDLFITNKLKVERVSTISRIKDFLYNPGLQTLVGLLGLLR